MANKTEIIYDNWNPNSGYVTHVAIQTESIPPYVFRAYGKGETLPNLPSDIVILPIEAARKLFDFKEGKLESIAKK